MRTAADGFTGEEIDAVLVQLEQASYAHDGWHDALLRTMLCHEPPSKADLAEDAHRRCLFGQWYYSPTTPKLKEHAGFLAIEEEHRAMHQMATQLLKHGVGGEEITPGEYDRFAGALKKMRLELMTLRQEFEDARRSLDPLTGAGNRKSMLIRLREQLALVQRGVHPAAIALMDLDRFKSINDTCGHPAGDKVLVALCQYLISNLRPYDKLFRYGGEEFLLCTPGVDAGRCLRMIERIRCGLAGEAFDTGAGMAQVTASFGVTMLEPKVSVEQSIERADKALYAAKAAGRNCTRFWDPALDAQAAC